MSVQSPPLAEVPDAGRRPVAHAHRSYVPDQARLSELSWSAVVLGAVLGIIFGASSLYLVLRVGMTVSASIPVAVLSITVFRALSRAFGTRKATILENNIVQTAGSAGESIAFGVGVTMPALMILGYDLDLVRVMLVASLGGLLGILMMIPLRRAFIVKQHGTLTYPEGTACAKVLIVGEQGGSSAKTVFAGFALAFVYQILMQALKLWQEYPTKAIHGFKAAVVSLEANPILMGVGYIIGSRISCVMVGGGVLAALVLVPAIALFGQNATAPIFPGTKPLPLLTPEEIQRQYVLYIGAGAVATGGIISLFQALPLILGSIRSGLHDLGASGGATASGRTERDLPLWFVGLGMLGLVAAIAATNLMPIDLTGRIIGAVMIVFFGFLFVTVSSRLTGEIGSSSNPISGMTVATLLLTCLIFVLMKWIGPAYRLAALSIAGIVCVAASNGGTTSQDLKTGFLVGATPRAQQLAILVGALTSAIVIGFTLLLLNDAGTIVTSNPEYLPTVRADVQVLTETAMHEGKTYHVWRVVNPIPGAQPGKYLVDDAGRPRFLVDPAINGVIETARRRREGYQVQGPQGDPDGLHHRRHHDPEAPVGPRPDRGFPRPRDPVGRGAGPGIRRRGVSAALDLGADLRRRSGPRGGRSDPADARRGVGFEPGGPALQRLHRRRRDRGHPDRHRGHPPRRVAAARPLHAAVRIVERQPLAGAGRLRSHDRRALPGRDRPPAQERCTGRG